jgi:hypothetical protein
MPRLISLRIAAYSTALEALVRSHMLHTCTACTACVMLTYMLPGQSSIVIARGQAYSHRFKITSCADSAQTPLELRQRIGHRIHMREQLSHPMPMNIKSPVPSTLGNSTPPLLPEYPAAVRTVTALCEKRCHACFHRGTGRSMPSMLYSIIPCIFIVNCACRDTTPGH